MPEIGPSGSEGGVARQRHPYPYRGSSRPRRRGRLRRDFVTRPGGGTGR